VTLHDGRKFELSQLEKEVEGVRVPAADSCVVKGDKVYFEGKQYVVTGIAAKSPFER